MQNTNTNQKIQRLVGARINSHSPQNQSLPPSPNTHNKKNKNLKCPKFDGLTAYELYICTVPNIGSLIELKPFLRVWAFEQLLMIVPTANKTNKQNETVVIVIIVDDNLMDWLINCTIKWQNDKTVEWFNDVIQMIFYCDCINLIVPLLLIALTETRSKRWLKTCNTLKVGLIVV